MDEKKKILVTGGCGFIGSHVVVELVAAGYDPVILDNYSNSTPDVYNAIKELTRTSPPLIVGDINHPTLLDSVFAKHDIYAVIHLAGLKSVNDSLRFPLEYYLNNFAGTLHLLEVMRRQGCFRLIFSSSATVYGTQPSPMREDMPTGNGLTNVYGKTKFFIEEMLKDIAVADTRWSIVLLRYFNPIGAHPSGMLRENPSGTPTNLFPYILQVAKGMHSALTIYGDDYDTKDGTGIRDFIHVVDLAQGHLACLSCLEKDGWKIYNLGTGKGTSVRTLLHTFEEVTRVKVPHVYGKRREGDIAVSYADVSKIEKELGWKARKSIADMCIDGWKCMRSDKST